MIIVCIVAYIMGLNIVNRMAETEGLDYQTITIWYIIISAFLIYIARKVEEGISKSTLDNLLPLSQRLERVERICNACIIDGGKMKCEYYRNPLVVITRCDKSKNSEGE
jgi:hypothetical protein